MRKDFIVLLLIVICGSCNENRIITDDNFKSKYPFNYFYPISKQLNYALSDSKDSTSEIRLWINYELFTNKRLLVFKGVGSNTLIQVVDFYPHSPKNLNSIIVDSSSFIANFSNIQIDSLLNKINGIGFETLTTQPDSIFMKGTDGHTYMLEVKKGNNYKVIAYHNPELYNDENNRKFNNIKSLLVPYVKFK